MKSKQSQKAGDNAQQIQTDNFVNINNNTNTIVYNISVTYTEPTCNNNVSTSFEKNSETSVDNNSSKPSINTFEVSSQIKERELAKMLFDLFRKNDCGENDTILYNVFLTVLYYKLNPKQKEIILSVISGLIETGYIAYHKDSPTSFILLRKAYDIIYDQGICNKLLDTPWIMPLIEKSTKNINWKVTYNKLWNVIGDHRKKGIDPLYIKGSTFYNLVKKFNKELPPTYIDYLEERAKEGKSTSRRNYYRDLIEMLDTNARYKLYGEIQLHLDNVSLSEIPYL